LLGPLPDEAALGSTWYLCRPGANCDAQIVADSLARQPDDHSVIEQAGFYFLRKRDNDRTVALFRHCVEVCQPDSGFFDPHAYLAYALLFKRDFAGARSEFTLSHKLNPDDPLDGILAITYFLEGNYAEASKLLAAARSAKAPDSPQEILLAYVCLVRLGRARQAEALLADRMEKFSGSEDEQLVLLRAVGRIKDFTPHWTTDELNQADAVLYAMVRLAKGDTDSARQALETTLQRGDKALPGFLGATIEMERLNRSSKP
jgi:tetratricopeptide (TPR) repeat protein